jgi:hypothetical protein
MPRARQQPPSSIVADLASMAVAERGPSIGRSIGRAMGVGNSSLADLVLASDVAAKFLESASSEFLARAGSSKQRKLQTPSLIAHSGARVVQAVLADQRLRKRVSELEQSVRVTVSPKTRGGMRLRQMRGRMDHVPLADAKPDEDHLAKTVSFLEAEGFTIERVGRFSVTATAPARLVSNLFKVALSIGVARRPPVDRALRMFSADMEAPEPEDLFVAPRQSIAVPGLHIHASIDDIVFVPPPRPSIAAVPPPVNYPVLDASALRKCLGIAGLGRDGAGVPVAVIDTGFFVDHPAFQQGNFDFKAIDTAPDDSGHGTAMAWSILNVAPGCRLRGYRKDDPSGAIERAADDGARIISCSWGWPDEQTFSTLQLSIRSVIEEDGATVIFAAGNGERFWPASDPLVLAVGGVYADPASGALQASNYASGFRSDLTADRNVPDVSGLCGLAPRGVYLPLPVPPASLADVSSHGFSFPDKDETRIDDGWIYDSGTSSATAQVAGVVALMTQHAAGRGLTLSPAQVKHCLQLASTAVESGRNAFGVPAVGQPNIAVGWGLVNAEAALREVDRL